MEDSAKKTIQVCCFLIMAAGAISVPVFGAPAPTQKRRNSVDPNLLREMHEGCQKGSIDPQKLIVRLQSLPELLDRLFPNTDRNDLIHYHACLSFVPDQSKSCQFFQGHFASYRHECQDLAAYAAFVMSTFRQGNRAEACQKFLEGDPIRQEDKPRFCEILAAALKSGQGKLFCERIKAAGIIPAKDSDECQSFQPWLAGSPNLCENLPEPRREDCRVRGALLTALRSGDPNACAASPFCGVLTSRKARACEPYLAKVTKSFCDRVATVMVKDQEARSREAAEEAQRKVQLMEAERRRAKMEKKQRKQFKKGEHMHAVPPEVEKRMREIESGAGSIAPSPSNVQPQKP